MEKGLAMVSLYSDPCQDLLKLSYHTLFSCTYDIDMKVIDVKTIRSVIAMVPHKPFPGDTRQRYFVVEKPGLDVAYLGGNVEVVPDEE